MSEPVPVEQLIGGTWGLMLNALVVTVRCNRCLLELAADDWQDHRDKECPVLYGEDVL